MGEYQDKRKDHISDVPDWLILVGMVLDVPIALAMLIAIKQGIL